MWHARTELDRLSERMNLGRSFLFKYVRASDQLAGILTKSAFASLLWQSSLTLWQVQQPEDFGDVRSSSLKPVSCTAFCTKELAQTMMEAERIDNIWDTNFSNKFGFKLHSEWFVPSRSIWSRVSWLRAHPMWLSPSSILPFPPVTTRRVTALTWVYSFWVLTSHGCNTMNNSVSAKPHEIAMLMERQKYVSYVSYVSYVFITLLAFFCVVYLRCFFSKREVVLDIFTFFCFGLRYFAMFFL